MSLLDSNMFRELISKFLETEFYLLLACFFLVSQLYKV
jgi:hypothetical protein